MERWRTIFGYEGYYKVSDLGRVYSLERKCPAGRGGFRRVKPRILKPHICCGYLHVNLHNEIGQKTYKIARLVLSAFVGPCPEGMESCHNDGNRRNDILENLRWDTRFSNAQDRILHGTTTRGELDATSKLTEVEVVKIKKALLEDGSKGQGRRLAKEFGVSEAAISLIRSGKRWGWHFWKDSGIDFNTIKKFRKLSRFDVVKIKMALKKDSSPGQNLRLAEKFNISDSAISDIRTGKNWSWLKV